MSKTKERINPIHHRPDFAAHPVRVTLCFKTQKDADDFMGQLCDGFGENFCDLDREWRHPGGDPDKVPSELVGDPNLWTAGLFNDDLN
jgi:hypothetical protein